MFSMSQKEEQIYRRLYEISAENRKGADAPYVVSEDIFVKYATLQPDRVDGAMLATAPKEEFTDLIFMTVLKRVIDDASRADWVGKSEKMEDEAYRTFVIRRIGASSERETKQIRYYNNILTFNINVKKANIQAKFQNILDFMYYKMYLKLPLGLRSFIKKVRRSFKKQ